MGNGPILVASITLMTSAIVLALVYYSFLKHTNRYAMTLVALPLAISPAFLAWLDAAYRVIRGFQQMARSGQGGFEPVATLLLEANRSPAWGHMASLLPLLLVLLLGTLSLLRGGYAPARLASARRSMVLIVVAAVCVLALVTVSEYGSRAIVLPLPVVVPAAALEDPSAPLTQAAMNALELETASIQSISAEISSRLEFCRTASLAMFFLALGFVVLNGALSLSVSFPRSVLVAGLVLALVATVETAAQLYRQQALAEEIDYLLRTYGGN